MEWEALHYLLDFPLDCANIPATQAESTELPPSAPVKINVFR